ncbi:MAG: sulfotransferase [Anaerolineaceae bacterium]|nr:sulfotransferase [Anaerolineaceae bacterium]
MQYNLKLLIRFVYYSFFKSRGTNYRVTWKRAYKGFIFFVIYGTTELFTWIGYLADEIFFPAYRRQVIQEPVFIIGNYRSGTTFLQRVISMDQENFCSMLTWEIVFASSITQRKIVWAIKALDTRLGKPLQRLLASIEKGTLEKVRFHKIGLREPEEDEYLFLHNFSTFGLWLYSIPWDLLKPYMRFDEEIAEEERDAIMMFYKRSLQRHFFAHGDQNHRLFSKNPAFTPKIKSILKHFPDARFINLVRNPLEMLPSHMNLLSYGWHVLADPAEEFFYLDESIEMAQHWYQYPLDVLSDLPEEQHILVNYDDLVSNPEQTVRRIYKQFNISITADFEEKLSQEVSKSRQHKGNSYTLKRMQISPDRILTEFEKVFSRFGFDPLGGKEEIFEFISVAEPVDPRNHIGLLKRLRHRIPWRRALPRVRRSVKFASSQMERTKMVDSQRQDIIK